jgi:hypothetical protein
MDYDLEVVRLSDEELDQDLTGRIFGDLLVVGQHPHREGWLEYRWLCDCSCGLRTTVKAGHLLAGVKEDCGCRSQAKRIRIKWAA